MTATTTARSGADEYYVTRLAVRGDLTGSPWRATLMRAGHAVADVDGRQGRDVRIRLRGHIDQRTALEHAAQQRGQRAEQLVADLVDAAMVAGISPDVDVAAVRAFLAARLEEDVEMATAAGHGVEVDVRRDVHRQPAWTRLDESANVRLSYDVRFVDRWSPDAVIEVCILKAQLALTGDVETVLRLAQEWGEHPAFDPAWTLPTPEHAASTLALLRAGY